MTRRYRSAWWVAGLVLALGSLAWADSYTGWLEVVSADSVSIRLSDGRIIDGYVASTQWAESLASNYHVGDKVKIEYTYSEPMLDRDLHVTSPLVVSHLSSAGKSSAQQLAAALASGAWQVEGNLLKPAAPPAPLTVNVEDDPTMVALRAGVLQYLQTMPNYVADERQVRSVRATPRAAFAVDQTLESEIDFVGREEARSHIVRNGDPWDHDYEALPGFLWSGSFGGRLQAIFDMECGTQFKAAGKQQVAGHETTVYTFVQPPDRCAGILTVDYQRFFPGVKGRVFFDSATGSVLRLEETMTNLPKEFPMKAMADIVLWGTVNVDGVPHLLQTGSEAETVDDRGETYQVVNQYGNYRKFAASHKIIVK